MSMKRSAALALAAAAAAGFVAGPALSQGLTAEQFVERNAAARGGAAAWRKIETMTWTGFAESASRGGRIPFVLEQKRPDRTRFEITVDSQKSVRVFDGTNGWKMRASAASRPDVQPYTLEELRFARGAPVILGPLMEYAARAEKISIGGLYEVEGRKAHALDLRLASGTSYRVWVDAETFLELRYDREFVNAQGKPVVSSVYFADYREVEGLRMPFTIETGTADGKARDKLVLERVLLNPLQDDRTFAKPGSTGRRRRGVSVDTRSAAQGSPAQGAPARPAR